MKHYKQAIAALLLPAALTTVVQAQQNTTITATIKDLPAGQWVYWSSQGGDDRRDSVQTTAGGFTIKTNIAPGEADFYIIKIGKPYGEHNVILYYLDKGNITIKGNGPQFKDAVFGGPQFVKDNNDYAATLKKAPGLQGRAELYEKMNKLYAEKDSAGLAALQPEMERMRKESDSLTKQWILQHPASGIGAPLLSYLSDMTLEEKESIFNKLSASAKENGPAKRLAYSIRVNKLTGIGSMAPDFTQNDTLGKPVSLKDFRGKYVLVDFWASWCVPCRGENPNVVAAFNKYNSKNFTVLGVSLDQPTGKEKWLNAIHQDNLTWTHVSDLKFWNNAVAKQYDIRSIPSNLLIDPSGKIIAKDLHGDELEKKLAEVL
ncbi:TlpA disulfide reductase family protein [Chitinophaga sp.]|uniref:TlpA disulfide reductase family protein n=1 Tax=Chitinophaga sp. TaxID=1869181 RepID=UPI002C8D5521|nr:TlpA disulfide reductase family protein [Chitinophaga sp.]HWV68066.1 TlpA disulfide reductase family protein [Chitinophaga sp.]